MNMNNYYKDVYPVKGNMKLLNLYELINLCRGYQLTKESHQTLHHKPNFGCCSTNAVSLTQLKFNVNHLGAFLG